MKKNKSIKTKALDSVVLIFVFSFIGSIFGYLSRIFLSKNLSLIEFGLFFAVFSFIQFFELFRSLGLGTTIIKYVNHYRALNKKDHVDAVLLLCVKTILTISLSITIILLLLSKILTNYYFKTSDAFLVFIVLSIWFFFRGIQDIMFTIFYSFQKNFLYCMRELRSIIFVIVLMILFLFEKSALYAAFSWLISSLIIISIFFPIFKKYWPKTTNKVVKTKTMFKKIVTFSFPVFLTELAEFIMGSIDIILLTMFSTLENVGIYNAILPTAMILFRFSVAIMIVSFPVSSALWAQKKIKQIRTALSLIYKYLYLILVPIMTLFFIYNKEIITILFGEEYAVGAKPFMILLLGVLFGAYVQINNTFLNSIDKQKSVTKVFFLGATVNVILNLILIPKFHLYGAAVATLVSFFIMFLISTFKLKKKIKFKFPTYEWIISSVMGILMYLVLKNFVITSPTIKLIGFDIVELIVGSIIGILIYFLPLLVFKVISISEIKGIIKRD